MARALLSRAELAAQPPTSLFHEVQGTADYSTLEEITYLAYRDFLSRMRERGAHLVRVWNMLPEVNRMEDGIECYQRFCRGRLKAFNEFGIEASEYPAASALGSKDGTYYFGFLASPEPVQLISNPMQVEAFLYPRDYGPVSPSFARASVWNRTLFISGTAAIRGHQSLYEGDIAAQAKCALENVGIIIHTAEQKSGLVFTQASGNWRVYLRHMDDRTVVEPLVRPTLGERIEFVAADVCRKELLMEIEGSIIS